MPAKDKETQRKISNDWYQKNKETHKANIAKNKKRYRAEWTQFKSNLQCSHCGFSHPAAIDFHHVIRDKGKQSVNFLVSQGRYAAAKEEIKKCIPLCSNCHRILHWDEDKAKKASLSLRESSRRQNPKSQEFETTETLHIADAPPSLDPTTFQAFDCTSPEDLLQPTPSQTLALKKD